MQNGALFQVNMNNNSNTLMLRQSFFRNFAALEYIKELTRYPDLEEVLLRGLVRALVPAPELVVKKAHILDGMFSESCSTISFDDSLPPLSIVSISSVRAQECHLARPSEPLWSPRQNTS